MLISIIIVNYNGEKWLGDCLKSIYRQRIKDLEIIVVDNFSTDNSVKFIKNNFPQVVIVKSKKNIGFGKGNNLGAVRAAGELLFFLNTDTKLLPSSLKEMLRIFDGRGVDLAGPKLLDFSNNDFYKNKKLTLDIVGSLAWGKKTTVVEGCCLMIKKSTFIDLGGFDASFFMYSEDLDLCWRAWLYGYKIKIINSARIKHYGGGSSLPTMVGTSKHLVPIFRRYETEKNTIRMMLKNASMLHLSVSLPIMLILIIGESFLYLCTNQMLAAKKLYSAIVWNVRHFPDTIAQRKVVQAKKKKKNIWPLLAKKITKFEVFKLIGIPKIKYEKK